MKIHQVVLYIIDHQDMGADQVKQCLENLPAPLDGINPRVARVDTRDVEYDERGPLNKSDDAIALPAFAEVFSRHSLDAGVLTVYPPDPPPIKHTCRGFFGLPPADGKPCPACPPGEESKCDGQYVDFQGATRLCLALGEGCMLEGCHSSHPPSGGY